MEANKLSKAKVQVLLAEPFFATVMLNLKFVADTTIQTAVTDGIEVRYNPDYIEGLTVEQIKGLIAHEVMHVTSLHHTRRNGRDLDRWNQACDYAINPILSKSGFEMPPGGIEDAKYDGKAAEEIYSMLQVPPPPPQKQPKPGEGKGKGKGDSQGQQPTPGQGPGDVKDAPAKTAVEMKHQEQATKQLIAQAMQVARQAGNIPGHLQEIIEEVLTPVVDWREVLAAYLTEIARNDYTFKRPNKRFIGSGLFLPSLESIERGKFVLMVDTSMSINKQLLNEFAGEMRSILEDLGDTITVIFIDTKVQNVQEFESDDVMDLNPKGRGGTDFKPGFEYLQKNEIAPAAVVYFTDGICNSFPDEPDYPVIWARYGGHDGYAPPFGETFKVQQQTDYDND